MGAHHDHHHGEKNLKTAFIINLVFTLIEIAGGLFTNSMAILSDALHDLGDSISLGLSWYLERYSKKDSDEKYTYGYRRFSLLGAFVNSLVLIVGSVVLLTHVIPRILNPEMPDAKGMFGLAILGVIFNGAAVLRLKGGDSLNEKVVRLHLVEDVLGWIAVLIVSIVLYFWEVPVLDPLLSLGITGYILINVYKNIRHTLRILMQAKPEDFDLEALKENIQQLDQVISVHDTHMWTMDGQYFIMTIHIVLEEDTPLPYALKIKQNVRRLTNKQGIEHVTIELEYEHESCELKACAHDEVAGR